MCEEKRIILKAVSMKDKDVPVPSAGPAAPCEYHTGTVTHWSHHSYVQQEQAQPLMQQNRARSHSLIQSESEKVTQAFIYSNRRAQRVL